MITLDQVLKDLAEGKEITEIDLYGHQIGDARVKALAEALSINKSVRYLI